MGLSPATKRTLLNAIEEYRNRYDLPEGVLEELTRFVESWGEERHYDLAFVDEQGVVTGWDGKPLASRRVEEDSIDTFRKPLFGSPFASYQKDEHDPYAGER